MPAPKFFRQGDLDIVNKAKENLARTGKQNPVDHSFIRNELILETRRIMPFNVAEEQLIKATRMVKDTERPRKTPAVGSMWLPGYESWPYEPQQMIPDEEGCTVDRANASPHFIDATAIRAEINLEKQIKATRRKQAESAEYSTWATKQAENGRPIPEITFNNFIHEMGYWQEDTVEGDDEGDDESDD